MVPEAFAESFSDATRRKRSKILSFHGDDQARVSAKLSDAERQRIDEANRDGFRPLGKRARQKKYWIDAAHFRIHRDGFFALRGNPHQRQPALARACKAHSFNRRMVHKGFADGVAFAHEQRENAFMQATFSDRALNHPTDQLRSSEMCRMSFRDYGASCRKCRGRVATRHRKRPEENCLLRKSQRGPKAIFRDLKSDRGSGFRSGSAESNVAEIQRPSRTTAANNFNWIAVLARSPSMRATGKPDSSQARSTVHGQGQSIPDQSTQGIAPLPPSSVSRKESNACSAKVHASSTSA